MHEFTKKLKKFWSEDHSFFVGKRLNFSKICEFLERRPFYLWICFRVVSLVSAFVLALCIVVLSLETVCPQKGCPWPRIFFVFLVLAMASSLVSSTPSLITAIIKTIFELFFYIKRLILKA